MHELLLPAGHFQSYGEKIKRLAETRGIELRVKETTSSDHPQDQVTTPTLRTKDKTVSGLKACYQVFT